MNDFDLRIELVETAQSLSTSGLSIGKSGNLSIRCNDGCLITPSGISYHQLSPSDIVKIDWQGHKICSSPYPPSSEWHFHTALYQHRRDINAITHAHPSYCTALACAHQSIPAFHYMVAIAGGSTIPLIPYALFGSDELANYVVKGLAHLNACLMANHGMIAVGASLHQAFNLAVEVEELAKQYHLARSCGEVRLLSDEQMNAALERFKTYGART